MKTVSLNRQMGQLAPSQLFLKIQNLWSKDDRGRGHLLFPRVTLNICAAKPTQGNDVPVNGSPLLGAMSLRKGGKIQELV